MKVVVTVLPLAARLEPWMLKMALYIAVQTAVLGVGLRAYGRFQNQPLMDSWRRGEISPLFLGTQRRR